MCLRYTIQIPVLVSHRLRFKFVLRKPIQRINLPNAKVNFL